MRKKITIPCIIDKMDNQASEACSAWPDRIFGSLRWQPGNSCVPRATGLQAGAGSDKVMAG